MAYSERLEAALVFAARIHRDQVRKGSEVPYLTHLLAVAALVGEAGGTEDQVIAGLLHDAIEDGIVDHPDIRAQIAARFGDAVLALVEGCTDTDQDPKPPWRRRKEAYLAHLRSLPVGHGVLLVSLADKLHNAHSIIRDHGLVGEALWERFNGGREGSLWYYRELVTIFNERAPGPLADELDELVEKVERVSGISGRP